MEENITNEIDFLEILKSAWEKFKANWQMLVISTIIGFLVPMGLFIAFYIGIMGAIQLNVDMEAYKTTIGSSFFIVMILFYLILFLYTFGAQNVTLKIAKNQSVSFKDFFLNISTYLKLIGLMIATLILVSIGLALCIIPGIILAFFLQFSMLIIIENPKAGIIDSIKYSFAMVKKNWKPVIITTLIISAISSVVGGTGIGLLVALPFQYLVISILYLIVKDKSNLLAIE
ncbi:MAG: hypothetical protein MJ211_03715 [Bacteroidales bacterium]|nr:hypothetical protein [Bacteroidales bacterium]